MLSLTSCDGNMDDACVFVVAACDKDCPTDSPTVEVKISPKCLCSCSDAAAPGPGLSTTNNGPADFSTPDDVDCCCC